MDEPENNVAIMKSIWEKRSDGRWGVRNLKGLTLNPKPGFEPNFFKIENRIELLTQSPCLNEYSRYFCVIWLNQFFNGNRVFFLLWHGLQKRIL